MVDGWKQKFLSKKKVKILLQYHSLSHLKTQNTQFLKQMSLNTYQHHTTRMSCNISYQDLYQTIHQKYLTRQFTYYNLKRNLASVQSIHQNSASSSLQEQFATFNAPLTEIQLIQESQSPSNQMTQKFGKILSHSSQLS